MTALLTAPVPVAAPTAPIPQDEPEPYRFSVDQYHAMIAAGILTPEDRAELIRGMVVTKMGQNSPHRIGVKNLRRRLEAVALPDPVWEVESQGPITFRDTDLEPDGAVCRAAGATSRRRNPVAADVALIGEVADTSLPYDRGTKKAIYAEARIPVYWIMNLIENLIEVYTSPTGPGPSPEYATRRDYRPGDEVPVVLFGTEVGQIPVSDLLPPPEGETP